MDHINLDRERRRQRALERLGSNHPTCVRCGNTDWQCLELHFIHDASGNGTLIICRNCQCKANCQCRKEQGHELDNRACLICAEDHPCCLEDHHIAGRQYSDITVVTCRNCHRKLTDMQRDHPS